MIEAKGVSKNSESGQVTMGHLLLAIAFFMPICMVMLQLKHSGGGFLRYLVAAPSTLVLGTLIVALNWKVGKAVWLRSQTYSKKLQNATAIALFALDLVWIVCGAILGFKLARLIEHVPR